MSDCIGGGAVSLGRRRAARLNPGRLLAPLLALVLPVIIADSIGKTNTRMLKSVRPANDSNDT